MIESWVIRVNHSSFIYDLSSIMFHSSFLSDDSLMNDERWWWMLISESRIMIHSLSMILYWWFINEDDESSLRVGIPSWLMSELWMMMLIPKYPKYCKQINLKNWMFQLHWIIVMKESLSSLKIESLINHE